MSRKMRTRNSMSLLPIESHRSRLKERHLRFQEAFRRPPLVDDAFSSSVRLEGMDYIGLEAFRAETKPATKGSNFG